MKHIFLFSAFFLISKFSFCQVVVGKVDINLDDNIQIIEVLIDRGMSRKSIHVYVDYGQKDNSLANNILLRNDDDMAVTNTETNQKYVFKSTAAALNFFEKNNWEHYNSLIETVKGYSEFYFYFRKKSASNN
jgi:hypothetical protein